MNQIRPKLHPEQISMKTKSDPQSAFFSLRALIIALFHRERRGRAVRHGEACPAGKKDQRGSRRHRPMGMAKAAATG